MRLFDVAHRAGLGERAGKVSSGTFANGNSTAKIVVMTSSGMMVSLMA